MFGGSTGLAESRTRPLTRSFNFCALSFRLEMYLDQIRYKVKFQFSSVHAGRADLELPLRRGGVMQQFNDIK